MKLSVVIPNYNGILLLEKCLATLDKQDFTDYDIIVIDDASTEKGTEETVVIGYYYT